MSFTPAKRPVTRINPLIASLMQRAKTAQASSGEVARYELEQQRVRRRERLHRTRPRIRAEAVEMIIAGEVRATTHATAVRDFMHAPNVSTLALIGTPGVGKSVAGAWAIAEHGGTYVHVHELRHLLAEEWDRKRQAVEARCAAPLCMLDDLGIERDPELVAVALLEFFDIRQAVPRGKTLMAANVGLETLRPRYPDPRLWSRLADAVWATHSGPDLREPQWLERLLARAPKLAA